MNYKQLYKAADENEAYFIKGLMKEYSIDVNLLGEGLSIAIGELPLEVKQVDILVHENQYNDAKNIIDKYEKDLQNSSNSKWNCPDCNEINPGTFEICWSCNKETKID
jgi:hypothetical protein